MSMKSWGQICPIILKRKGTFPHGLENNHACKWILNNFPAIIHLSAFLENCQKSICMHGFSPIYVEKSYSLLEFHGVRFWSIEKGKFIQYLVTNHFFYFKGVEFTQPSYTYVEILMCEANKLLKRVDFSCKTFFSGFFGFLKFFNGCVTFLLAETQELVNINVKTNYIVILLWSTWSYLISYVIYV